VAPGDSKGLSPLASGRYQERAPNNDLLRLTIEERGRNWAPLGGKGVEPSITNYPSLESKNEGV